MQPFAYQRATSTANAVQLGSATASRDMPVQFIAGGTTLLDLMKLGSLTPTALVDINDLSKDLAAIRTSSDGLHLGALARMSQAADHADVRANYPVIAQSLQLAASAQLRNMATLGGNVLQRTRCQYFRDPSWQACNKRNPGSGCAAIDGVNRKHAVLGTSDACIATYPGDFAQALVALGAQVGITGAKGTRSIEFEALHREADRPEIETVLQPGDLITHFTVPSGAWTRRSLYLKVRDRQSYEFALASAAVALDLDGNSVREARIALGGLAYKPWRAKEAEAALKGKPLNEDTARQAAATAMRTARAFGGNAYKVDLGQRTLVRALMQARDLEI
jgi:xanthine dehydrogenase YagS FAD-binding subunit